MVDFQLFMKSPTKSKIQSILNTIGVYHRLKVSSWYDLYCRVANRTQLEARKQELHFYRGVLNGFKNGDLIFDIGANLGHKTQTFLHLGGRVIAVEPDEQNQNVLAQSFHAFRVFKKPVVIVGKAVSDQTGSQTLWIEQPGSALNTLSTKWVDALQHDSHRFGTSFAFREQKVVQTITMDDLIKGYGRPFYIKIDVEGHEASVLSGMHIPVPFVSFEVNLPEFHNEGLSCIDTLERIAGGGRFNFSQDSTRGLALNEWLSCVEFKDVFNRCTATCIEVFWRSSLGATTHHS